MIEKRKIEPHFVDGRGKITNLLEVPIQHVTLITSNAGAIRANHIHREDAHYSYLLSGQFDYFEEVEPGKLRQVRVEPGDMVFTPVGVPHAMRFLEESVFIAFTTRERDRGKYDADTSPYKLIGS